MLEKRGVLHKRILNMFMALVLLAACIFTAYPGSMVHAGEPGQENTYYVSPSGNDGWSGKLAEPNGSGTDGPFKTIARANQVVQAGDTVIIRGGSYDDPINPKASGTEDSPIVYKNHEGEEVKIYRGKAISGLTPEEQSLIGGDPYGLYIYGKSYITIEGIKIDFTSMGDGYAGRWGRIVNSDHITLKDVVFRYTAVPGTSGGVCFINSHYNIIRGCTFDDGNDNLILVQSNYNLIEGSIFTKGRHTLWCIRAGSYNVIRNNYFHNELQKIGEIYDNGAYSATKYGTLAQDSAKHNIVENNVFAYTPHGSGGPYNGIQFAGQSCIIRNNIFYDNCGGGLGMTTYEDEAYYNYNNRIYNNTFVSNQGGGIAVTVRDETRPDYFFYNNIFKNNIISNNIYTEEGNRHNYPDWVALRGKPVQIWGIRKDGFIMRKNVIYSSDPDYAVAYGDNSVHNSVSWMENQYPYLYASNITNTEPEFVRLDTDYDPSVPFSADHDFTLKEGSPLIDAGEFLTTVLPLMVNGSEGPSSGKSSVISVKDPLYFSDGFGIVEGDTIKLENGETAVVVDIEYGIRHNRITLDREVNWSKGMGISLNYGGSAPDMGAIEIGVPRPPIPEQPETPTTPETAAVKITGPSLVSGTAPFSLTYGLENVTGITAQIITISYDKERFKFVRADSIREGTEILETEDDADTGTVEIILVSLGKGNAINGNADILKLMFEPQGGAIGTGIITVAASLSDSDGGKFYPAEEVISIQIAGKAVLAAKIQEAQEIYNNTVEGIMPGQYPAGAKSALKNIIDRAVLVRDDESATAYEILQAIEELDAAVARFLSLIITDSTGDIDDEEGIGIGDLGIIAGYYGVKEGDPEWNDIKFADINGDGEIGLYELAFIARRIILK